VESECESESARSCFMHGCKDIIGLRVFERDLYLQKEILAVVEVDIFVSISTPASNVPGSVDGQSRKYMYIHPVSYSPGLPRNTHKPGHNIPEAFKGIRKLPTIYRFLWPNQLKCRPEGPRSIVRTSQTWWENIHCVTW
jgi:hypothetical protein